MNQKYLIDSDVFFQAKNFHYRFDFCEGFWNWLEAAHHTGMLCSTQKVKDELMNGNDDDLVKQWVKRLPSAFFIPDTKDATVMQKYAELMIWTNSNLHYTDNAKKEFANIKKADAFLIAVAMAKNYKIVTHERSEPNRKNKIKIPDAALQNNVSTVLIYDLLSEHAVSNFQLKAA